MINAYATSGTSPTFNTPEPLSLADRIERIGRALTADELAEMLAVSRITIFKQAKAGRIPSFRIGTAFVSTPGRSRDGSKNTRSSEVSNEGFK